MIFTGIKGITIPEGSVKQIADGAGRVLWKSAPSSIVPGLVIGYSGDYTDQPDVVMGDGKTYRLLTLTGSGTLTLDKSVKADVWLCAGGNGGRYGGRHGGGGGLFVQSDGMQLDASTVCTVGAGASAVTSSTTGGVGSSTTFGDLTAAQETGSFASAKGASGGGGGGRGTAAQYAKGTGGGVSTVPFGDSHFDTHSGGGGGGGYRDQDADTDYSGGAGGADGADGNARSSSGYNGGAGGVKGGGVGGAGASGGTGGDATYYGGGGGGGGYFVNSSGSTSNLSGGSGYQGVIYVRIPYEQ